MQKFGLKQRTKKAEYVELAPQTNVSLKDDEPLQKATSFEYLRSYVTGEGGAQRDVKRDKMR